MRIDHLVTQLQERLESGDLRSSGSTEIEYRGGTGNFRSKEGAAAVMARAAAPKIKQSPPTDHPDIVLLTRAAETWARSSTNLSLLRREDIIKDKKRTVTQFFIFFFMYIDKDVDRVAPNDITEWQNWLQNTRQLKATTLYNYCSQLKSFFDWLMKHAKLGRFFRDNPVAPAFPKCPPAYQSDLTSALSPDEMKRLWKEMERARDEGGIVGKRDYALFVFYAATGDRRAEIINLRSRDINFTETGLTYRVRLKGGRRGRKTVDNQNVLKALLDYVTASGRDPAKLFARDAPIWLPHDTAKKERTKKNREEAKLKREELKEELLKKGGDLKMMPKPEKPRGLSSHAFARRMKRYAQRAGINDFHLHMIRHTFADRVSKKSGSYAVTQDALGHSSQQTTRLYVPNIETRKNPFSSLLEEQIGKILDIS